MNRARLRRPKIPFRIAVCAAAFRPACLHHRDGHRQAAVRDPVPFPAEARLLPVRRDG